ncbi:MAG: MFS transporter [Anaerolineae bacterium]|nr:MFS transporter [Anaerolineae bacterium]
MKGIKRTKLLAGISVFWLALALLLDGLNSLVLPVQLFRLGADDAGPTTLGLLTFAGILAAVVIQPFAGEISDRLRATWGRTGIIAASLFAILAGLFALGAAPNLLALFVAYLAIQIAAAFARAAQGAFIGDLLPYDKTNDAARWRQTMQVVGSSLGFLLLGNLLAAASIGPALMVVGATLTVAFLATVVLIGERPRPHGYRHSSPTWDDLYRFDFRGHRRYAWLIVSRSLFLLGAFGVARFLIFFLGGRFGLDTVAAAGQAGLLLGGLALVTALIAPLAAQFAERWGHGFTMAGGALIAVGGLVALALASAVGHVLLGALLIGFGGGAFLSANTVLADELIPAVHASKFHGIAHLGGLLAAAFAGLFGPLADWMGHLAAGNGYTVIFGAALIAFALAALAARPGLAVAPRLGEPAAESVRD